jgi:hypothetical protein
MEKLANSAKQAAQNTRLRNEIELFFAGFAILFILTF